MKQDNAVVIFGVVLLFAALAWKIRDVRVAVPVVPAVPEDAPDPVIADGPDMIVPAHAARAPYRLLPPAVTWVNEVSNRRRAESGLG